MRSKAAFGRKTRASSARVCDKQSSPPRHKASTSRWEHKIYLKQTIYAVLLVSRVPRVVFHCLSRDSSLRTRLCPLVSLHNHNINGIGFVDCRRALGVSTSLSPKPPPSPLACPPSLIKSPQAFNNL